jgi:hypothetical protein
MNHSGPAFFAPTIEETQTGSIESSAARKRCFRFSQLARTWPRLAWPQIMTPYRIEDQVTPMLAGLLRAELSRAFSALLFKDSSALRQAIWKRRFAAERLN